MSLLVVFGAVALVGIASWMWSGAVVRSRMHRQILQIELKAESLEAANDALHGQLEKLEQANDELRHELDKERELRIQSQTRLEEASRSIKEQKKLLDEATERLKASFNRLATGVLKSSNEVFIDLARKALEGVVEKVEDGVGRQHEEIRGLMEPIAETLKRFESRVSELEAERQRTLGALESQVAGLAQTSEVLQRETAALVSALKRPGAAGTWGPVSLRHIVETVGLAEFCVFSDESAGVHEPNLVVRLPGGRSIAVDAGAPLDDYFAAMAAEDETERQGRLTAYAAALRQYLASLGPNGNGTNGKPELSVLFLPGDGFLAAALEKDQQLVDDGLRSKVVIATPGTLVALLKSVALTWQQEKVVERSEQIRAAGRELFERVSRFTDHLDEIGEGLRRTTKSYNDAVANWNARLVPGARRLGELTTPAGEETAQSPQAIDHVINEVRS